MADYAVREELKSQIGKVGATHDTVLDGLITAASEMIDKFCNRPMGFIGLETAVERLYSGNGVPYLYIDDCVDVELVEVKESVTDSTYTSWAATDWIKFSGSHRHPNFNNIPYTGLMIDPNGDYDVFTSGQFSSARGFRPTSLAPRSIPTVQVTANWGYAAAVPAIISQATITQAARWYSRGKSGWADTMASNDFGVLAFKQSLDPDVKMLLVSTGLVRANIA